MRNNLSKLIIDEDFQKGKKYLEKYLDILEAMDESVIVAVTNAQGMISYVNNKFLEISHYQIDELVGKTHRVVNSGYHTKSFFKEMWETINSGKIWTGEIRNKTKHGDYYWVSTTIVPFLNEAGKPYQHVAIRTDITARVKMEQELHHALEDNFQNTIKQLTNLIFKIHFDSNKTLRFIMSEGKMAERLNFTTEIVAGKKVSDLFPENHAKEIEKFAHQAYLGEHVSFELQLEDSYFSFHFSPIIKDGKVKEVVGTTFDITKRKEDEAKIKYLAYHDPRTGLPNRVNFTEKLEGFIKQAKQDGGKFAVFVIDLDHFKNINDTLGHTVGDELLKAVGVRLKQVVTKRHAFIARLGGDEFSIISPVADATSALNFAEMLLYEVGNRFEVSNLDLYISPSIGISMYPEDGTDYNTLIRHADAAMYHAKERGRNTFQFFKQNIIEQLEKKRLLESSLREAVIEDEFILHFQPQIDLKTNDLIGVEALIRWQHPELGMISPLDFIPLAEDTGLIVPIGKWVLRTACKQNKAWQDAGHKPMIMAVNISMRQLMSRKFPQLVEQVLSEVGLEPQYLDLEITESMTANIQHIEEILLKLRKIGVQVSIDDFGTGYSSLSYLSKLPINKLKIDQAFLRELNPKNKAVVKAVISLSKSLDLDVLAEGAETKEHIDLLSNFGCESAQGYYYSRPVEAVVIDDYLNKIDKNSGV